MKRSIFLLALPFLLAQCNPKEEVVKQQPMPVHVAHPVARTVELTDIYTGRFSPVEEVDLRPRVSGYIDSVHFKEGQKVHKGDLMVRIDPRPFDAAVANADARLKQVEARHVLAENNLARAMNLVNKNAIAREEFDIRESEVKQAAADVLAAKAALTTAKLDREFADIHAPISGIAGKTIITPGNFVSGGNAGADILTTIVPHHPIYCYFEVDERRVLEFTRLYFKGEADGREGEPAKVEIAVSDSDEFEFQGTINFSENQLDPNTATLQIRALVDNENEFLTPGLFARVRGKVGEPIERMLVRDSALGFDQSKRFAWVLKDDNTVERRYVEVGSLQEGGLRVITDGLTTDEKIAVSGIQLLRPGAPLAPSEVEMVPNSTDV
ncbi:efflux RND transporter periplasmic adaptor subunit [Haloferula chungangensis]|uniref:Efflux RND transporter periplasmic adaptor subunit n=1 Tax=Haloferula chungangensis TaxID=1048331 RepID=A0ABW2L3N2_9BACT